MKPQTAVIMTQSRVGLIFGSIVGAAMVLVILPYAVLWIRQARNHEGRESGWCREGGRPGVWKIVSVVFFKGW